MTENKLFLYAFGFSKGEQNKSKLSNPGGFNEQICCRLKKPRLVVQLRFMFFPVFVRHSLIVEKGVIIWIVVVIVVRHSLISSAGSINGKH